MNSLSSLLFALDLRAAKSASLFGWLYLNQENGNQSDVMTRILESGQSSPTSSSSSSVPPKGHPSVQDLLGSFTQLAILEDSLLGLCSHSSAVGQYIFRVSADGSAVVAACIKLLIAKGQITGQSFESATRHHHYRSPPASQGFVSPQSSLLAWIQRSKRLMS